MKSTTRISTAERLGRWAGKFWRGYVRQEQRATGWLVARDLPFGGAKALLWSVKLILLGVLLYAAFWLALLVLFAVAVAWATATRSLSGLTLRRACSLARPVFGSSHTGLLAAVG